ncbi:MAG: hypothetical protein ACLQBA_24945 [Candidatus Binataceae bacterium]
MAGQLSSDGAGVTIQEILSEWKTCGKLENPPAQPVLLWRRAGSAVWISNGWGPAVPYHAIDHSDGTQNHGYVRLKDNLGAAAGIPEVAGWSELQRFLQVINAPESPIESVGCEKCFASGEERGQPVKLGSYIDLIFSESRLIDHAENHLLLASHLIQALAGCEKWWTDVEFRLERNRALAGSTRPWGLMLHIANYGKTKEQARQFWGVTLSRMGDTIQRLPRHFRFDSDQL